MTLDQAYRLKTFAAAAAILLAIIVMGSTWSHGTPPSGDPAAFVQSGGLVPDDCDEVASDRDTREAALHTAVHTHLR